MKAPLTCPRWPDPEGCRSSQNGDVVCAVLFDLFGTLVKYELDRTRLSYPSTHDLLRRSGFKLGHDDFVELWDTASRQLEERTSTSHIEFSMRDACAAFCEVAGLNLEDAEVDEVAMTFVHEWRQHVVAVEGAAELVDALSEQVAVAIVSNTHDAPMVGRLLGDIGLGAIGNVVLSIEHGYRKPHPSIYAAALEAVGSAAQDAVFVGDALVADYLAPQELGMRAFLIDPTHRYPIAVTDRLSSVVDLAPRLQELA